MPDFYKGDAIFEKAFRVAEGANFTPEESWDYMISLKRQRDNYAGWKYSYDEGKTDGKIEGKIEALLQLFNKKLGAIPP